MASSKDDGMTPPATTPRPPAISSALSRIGLILRSLLFAVTVASVTVMVTGKQTKEIISLPPFPPLVMVAKFDYSPSFIYFVVATAVACVYSLVSAVGTAFLLRGPNSTSGTLSFLLVFFDANCADCWGDEEIRPKRKDDWKRTTMRIGGSLHYLDVDFIIIIILL